MGLPLALDGLPDNLKLNKAVECPKCKRDVLLFRTEKDSEGHIRAVCGLCKQRVPESFHSQIKEHLS